MHLRLKTAILSTALCWPLLSTAQEINLKSTDGSIDLSGDLIEYQDGVYVLNSQFGVVRITTDQVDCFGGGCPDTQILDQEVTFSGSDAIANGLMPVLLASYAAATEAEPITTETIGSVETNTQFIENLGFGDLSMSFRVRSSISSDAFVNLLGRSAEIGVSSRRITIEEARALREYGAGSMVDPANEHIFANDSIIVVTHPSNPVKSITMDELRAIYSGEISNWSELGGNDAQITSIHLGRGSGTRGVFEERVLRGAPGQPIATVEAEGSTDVSRQIEGNENAVGYVSFAFKRGSEAMTLVNECGIAMEPDAFSAKTGEYIMQRPLYFYTRGDTVTPEAEDFLTWAKSPSANAAIFKSGFIDLGVAHSEQGPESLRAQNVMNADLDAYEIEFANTMLETMGSYDRLSSTFRFNAGSSRLTAQSRAGLDRLITYLETQPAGDYKLVGFTDDQGPFDANLDVSLDRAEQMIGEIAAASAGRLDHITFSAEGFGELAPVACNANNDGRAINRRVEVWAATSNG